MLEGERYDLEKRFRAQQQYMLEMAEKARAQNQSGDRIQEKYSGAPAMIPTVSKYERKQEQRSIKDRIAIFQKFS